MVNTFTDDILMDSWGICPGTWYSTSDLTQEQYNPLLRKSTVPPNFS
jgi:hypothetical protein